MFVWSWMSDRSHLPFLWPPLQTRSSGDKHSSSPMAFARGCCPPPRQFVDYFWAFQLHRAGLVHDPIYSYCSWVTLLVCRVPLPLPSSIAWIQVALSLPSTPGVASCHSITSPFVSRWRSRPDSCTNGTHRWPLRRRKLQLRFADPVDSI